MKRKKTSTERLSTRMRNARHNLFKAMEILPIKEILELRFFNLPLVRINPPLFPWTNPPLFGRGLIPLVAPLVD